MFATRSGFVSFCVLVNAVLCTTFAQAQSVELYVDSAPNIYGSDAFDQWWQDTRWKVQNDLLEPFENGTYRGSLAVDPIDEIVYSTGDLGRRLHWIFWIPGWVPEIDSETGDPILEDRLRVKFIVDWEGSDWTWNPDDNELIPDGPDRGWSAPSTTEVYGRGLSQGLMGTFGFAWWAYDDLAEPYDTPGTSPFDETDEADIAAMRELVLVAQTYARGMVEYVDEDGVAERFELVVEVPFCGDGAVNGAELCDDGEQNGSYGYCATDCSGPGEHCGDGLVNGPEECDDGNQVSGDGCSADCLEEAPVGDADQPDAGVDAGVDADETEVPPSEEACGCGQSGGRSPMLLALALVLMAAALRRRSVRDALPSGPSAG